MREKLLVIGAGINQLPLIQCARKLGYHVIAVSPEGNYPGLAVADEVLYEDIFHKDAILAFAKNAGIKGVISDQSDMATPIVAFLAEKLGLPTYGYENALTFTDKFRMRRLYESLHLPVPAYGHAQDLESALAIADRIGYPLVIKPADSFASRGVFKIRDAQTLRGMFDSSISFSRSGTVVLEQYIDGKQYFCQGYVDRHQLTLYAFSDRYYFDLPLHCLPYTNAFPARISDAMRERMRSVFEKVIHELDPAFGQVWAEWIHDEKTDTLYLIEMAIRGGGAFVTTHLIPSAYGVDSQPYLIHAAMGHYPKTFSEETFLHKAAAFYCFLLPEGVVTHVEGTKEIADIPGVMATNLRPIQVGDVIAPIQDKSSRFGPILIRGDSRDELDGILQQIQATLRIRVATSEGEKGIIWS